MPSAGYWHALLDWSQAMPYPGAMATDTAGQARMTGDDLITQVTQAGSTSEARRIVDSAPREALFSAADMLYVETDRHGMRWIRNAVLSEARA